MEELKALLSWSWVRPVKYDPQDIEKRVANDPRIHPQKRLLSFLLYDKTIPPIPTEKERIEMPFRRTNFISEAFYIWLKPLLTVGYRRTIQPEDLYKISKGSIFDVERRANVFLKHYAEKTEEEETKYLKKIGVEDNAENRKNLKHDANFHYSNYIVLSCIFATFRRDYSLAVLFKAIADVAAALNTIQIRALIEYVQKKANGEDVGNNGYGLAVGVAVIVFWIGLFSGHAFNDAGICGAEVKGVLIKVLLDKSFRLSRKSKLEFPASKVTSLMGNDVSKIDLAANYFPFIICLPIGLTISIVLLAVRLGGASLGGIAYFLLFTFIISITTRQLIKWRKLANIQTDSRVQYIKEILQDMKMLKYYAWELPFFNIISNVRSKEMNIMLKIQFVRNFITGIAVTLPLVSALVGFLAMFGQNHGLKSAANIFSSLTLFNILTMHISMLPLALSSSGDALISFKRIQEFLLAEEEDIDPKYHVYSPKSSAYSIEITKGFFSWEEPSEDKVSFNDTEKITDSEKDNFDSASSSLISTVSLHDINISIKQGEFIVITGSIGSGKSSLLSAIYGSMPRLSGSIDISGKIVLCAQPWIQNTTVRENIIFGSPYDGRENYDKVVECCALPSDFEILPAGDMTEIGERGVNLSGGQKARINLARAVYRAHMMNEYNIIMLDDVLSAVDAKVGKHIMNECILGILKDKTRILATHQLSLIGEADRIIYLNGDGTVDIGTNEELVKKNAGFRTLMEFQMEGQGKKKEEEIYEDVDDEDVREAEAKLIRKQTTKDENYGKLIQKEEMKSNGIPTKMIKQYLVTGCGKLGPGVLISNLILAIAMTSFMMIFENVWLSFWSTKRYADRTNGFYIGIYVMVTILFVLCAIWQFCTIVYITNRSSKLLNIQALKRIMHAPMAFFDTTPMGRITNRFTKDTDVLDNEIAEQTRLCCFGLGNMIGILVLCCVYLPWFTITIPFIIGYIFIVFNYYEATAREVKRLEGVSRSLVFSTFDEVLHGMETIKLYASTGRFIDRNTDQINIMNESYLTTISLQRWFSIGLHGCSGCLNLIISMLCVSRAYPISAAASGLVISYLVQFSLQVITFSRSMGQVEQQLSSVERICEYATETPQEASYRNPEGVVLRSTWPEQGAISFNNISLRYRPELPYVLKNLTLNIKPGEKIGICGRTGAGKSTIMTALYRLSEPEGGEMCIDGVDLQKIGLFELRSHLAIIPQDPVLFRGTIRNNLDPFQELSDSVLQNALDRACGVEDSAKFNLDGLVEDGGANFSLGERQVLALCRALVRDSKVLILDEATSSVDYETDARIQKTIAEGFTDCTILCIAHRLRTILEYDRILVMDKGEAVEFDGPKALWLRGGIFRSMCDKSGIEETDFNKM